MKGMMDIVHSPLFSLLDKSFINEIKTIGYSNQKVLIVTKSDEVYGMGLLPDSGVYADNTELRPIPQLHKKNVERFIFGEKFVFILTESGDLFGWGENSYGQLGFGHQNHIYVPTLVSSFEGEKVTDIACGVAHAVALCSDQQVYFWGYRTNGALLQRLRGATNAVGIACSAYAGFYLSSNGEVYGIGYLHNQSHNNHSTWQKINNFGNIKKLVCGKSHAMALHNDGMVFVWGDNEKKQLSYETLTAQGNPMKLSCISDKIIDIAANPQSDLSVAMTESSKIYVWGGHSEGCFSKPYLTWLASFEEVFCYHSHPSMTYKGITFQKEKRNKFLETGTLESVFDVEEDSDLTIIVQEKTIHVHKAILKARSKYFLAMFTKQWEENNKKILKIDGYSYDSYRSFLLYLYTGEIDITSENVFELMTIADKYSDDTLLELIEKKLDNCSIPDEIVRVLKDIMKLSSPNFEKFCDGVKKMISSSTSENL